MSTTPDPADYLAGIGMSTLEIAESVEKVDALDTWITAAAEHAVACNLAAHAEDWPTVEQHSHAISSMLPSIGITDERADIVVQRMLALLVDSWRRVRAAEGRPVL